MHSRIFIMQSKEDIKERGFGTYREQEDFVSMLSSIDYVTFCDKGEFRDSVEWLNRIYSIKNITVKEIEVDGERGTVAVVTSENIKKIVAHAQKIKKNSIETAKMLLSKPMSDINLSIISGTIYPTYSFWFEINGELMPEVDIIYFNFDSLEELYITEIYDYHF